MIRIDIRPVWRFTIEGREKDFDFQLISILEALHQEPKLAAWRRVALAGIQETSEVMLPASLRP